ncbi:MAG: hypothetical protein K2H73_06505, partial [Treponemataceae bacterium]|nr:hypothetical protein [Treponemataceae bacterium]
TVVRGGGQAFCGRSNAVASIRMIRKKAMRWFLVFHPRKQSVSSEETECFFRRKQSVSSVGNKVFLP